MADKSSLISKQIEELEKKISLQDAVIKSSVHDVRNKNQLQQGSLEMVLNKLEPGYKITEEDISYLETAMLNSTEIDSILENQLVASELETKQDYEIIDMCEVLDDNVQALETNLEHNNTELIKDYEDVGNSLIYTTPLIKRATYNIIDNSIKYGDNLVEVTVSDTEDYVQTIIADNGEGIPDRLLESMFPDESQCFEDYPSTGSAIINDASIDTNIDLDYSESSYGGSQHTLTIPKPHNSF